jgi:hypothetical protein
VFLAGDAAHTHPPIGGQGLNVGLQDAVNLGWKMAAVLRGEASDALLDTYHTERFAVEEAATQWSLAQTELVKPGPRRAAMREVFSELITIPEACLRLSGQLSGLSLRYDLGDDTHPLVGLRMPNLALTVDGRDTDVFALLRQARPLLVELGGTPRAADVASRPRLVHVTATYRPDVRGGRWHFPVYGDLPAFDAVLIRPDGYVAWVGPSAEPAGIAALSAALDRWVGTNR